MSAINEEDVCAGIENDKVFFNVDIVDHCDLNCMACEHFSSVAKENIISVEAFHKDMKRLSDILDGEATVAILGGEPLLHPEVDKIFDIARELFPGQNIFMFTNGLTLDKMTNSFWKSMVDNRIIIRVTKTPALNTEKAEKILESHNAIYFFKDKHKKFTYQYLSMNKVNSLKNKECEGKYCCALRDGKLYLCVLPANIYRFNEYFKTNFKVEKEDYIDIYDPNITKEFIIKKSKKGVMPFCRYCQDKWERTDWKITEKKLDEWVKLKL